MTWHDIERRSAVGTVRTAVVRERGEVRRRLIGTAAPFGSPSHDLGGFIEIIEPGAFRLAPARVSRTRKAGGRHSPEDVIGVVVEQRDGIGALQRLEYEVDLPSSDMGKRVEESIDRRDVTGNSFAFTVAKGGERFETRPDGTIVRHLLPDGIKELIDVGPVTFPAYADTVVAARCRECVGQMRPCDALAGKWAKQKAVEAEIERELLARHEGRRAEIALDRLDGEGYWGPFLRRHGR